MIKNVFLTILLFLCFENCISQNTNNNQDSVFKQNLDLGHYYIRNGKIDSLKIQLLKLDSLFLLSKKDSTKLYELKVLKEKENRYNDELNQMNLFFSDGVPLNSNILAIKT